MIVSRCVHADPWRTHSRRNYGRPQTQSGRNADARRPIADTPAGARRRTANAKYPRLGRGFCQFISWQYCTNKEMYTTRATCIQRSNKWFVKLVMTIILNNFSHNHALFVQLSFRGLSFVRWRSRGSVIEYHVDEHAFLHWHIMHKICCMTWKTLPPSVFAEKRVQVV